MNIKQIKRKISKLQLEELAISSGFQKRKPKKLEIVSFLGAFWLMVTKLEHSLSYWSRSIGYLQGSFVSKQALDKRLRQTKDFAKALLKNVLKQPLQKELSSKRSSSLFSPFNNVYVEDSTCISLPNTLAKVFPGSHNRFGQSATARIQLRLNLLKDLYTHIEVQSFRDNDQKHAKQILSIVQAKDLVLRDLGYWSLRVMQKIASASAFFLSRYKYGTALLNQQGQPIDLVKKLKAAQHNGQMVVDMPVGVGKKLNLSARLVAIKAPQAVALKRKRAAKKNRDRRLNRSSQYYYLLEWTLFITNVDKSTWKYKSILKAYRLRWRIEMIFKCWKSKFKFEYLFKKHQSLHPNRAISTIYLLLVMLTLFYAKWYYFFSNKVYQKTGKQVSPFKFADFVKEHFWDLIQKQNSLEDFVPLVAYYFTYEKRKRPNHLQLLFDPLS